MRRFLVWAAATAALLLVSAANSCDAKPFERKKPRSWMLAGDVAGNEKLALQPSSGYLRGSETVASLADKASISTTDKVSTTKTNPSPSASYGAKTAAPPSAASSTTAPAAGITTTSDASTDVARQSPGVSSVIVPWGSVTTSYASTEAPATALDPTDKTTATPNTTLQESASFNAPSYSGTGAPSQPEAIEGGDYGAGYSSANNVSKKSNLPTDGSGNGAEPPRDLAHNPPAYDGVLGRVIPWNDGRLQPGTEKFTLIRGHAQGDAYSDGNDDTKPQSYGHPLDNLVPWSHSLIQRELQAEDTEQPTDQPVAEESRERTEEQPASKSADQTEDKPTEQPTSQPWEKSADQPTEDADAADDDERMKTTAVVVDENVRWNQDDCDPCDVPTQPPTLAPPYPRKDDDYEQHLPNVTDENRPWGSVKEEPVYASTKPPKKRGSKPPKTDLIRCTKVIGEYGESYECETGSTLPPNGTEPSTETPYGTTPSPEPPETEPPGTDSPGTEPPGTEPPLTETPQETPAATTTEPPTEAPYPSEPATTSPPTEPTPSPTKPGEPTPSPTIPGEPTPAPTRPSEPTPSPTKGYGESTPVSTTKGTSTLPTGTKASTSKTSTPTATKEPSTTTTSPTSTSTDTNTRTEDNAYGTSGTAGGSNGSIVGASTSEGDKSSGASAALSGGAIAGIVIACVLFVAVVVGAVFFRQRSIARQREENLFADLAASGGRALETDYAAM